MVKLILPYLVLWLWGDFLSLTSPFLVMLKTRSDIIYFIKLAQRKHMTEAIWWKLFCVKLFVKIKFTKLPRAFSFQWKGHLPFFPFFLFSDLLEDLENEYNGEILIMISHKTTGSSSKFSQSRFRNKNPDFKMSSP